MRANSSGWVLDIVKWFKRWGVKDLLEALMATCKVEYCTANVNPQYFAQYKGNNVKMYTNHTLVPHEPRHFFELYHTN